MNILSNAKVLTVVLCATLFVCQADVMAAGSKSKTSRKGGEVLAEVNGSTITKADLNLELGNLPEHLKSMAETPQGRRDMVESMVIRELILQQAAKEGLDKDAEIVKTLRDIKKRLIVESFLKRKVETGAQVSDADLQKFYEENRDKFQSGEQIRASHILLKTDKEAGAILDQLKAGGNFEELAKKSACRDSAAKGGDLGWFGKGVMVQAFEDGALALKEGEYSGVVKTDLGYHIIKLTGKRAAEAQTFDEVREQIKTAIIPAKQQEVFKRIKEDLRKNARITIKEDVLKDLNGKKQDSKKGKEAG